MNKPRFSIGMTLAIICATGTVTMLLFHLHLLMYWQAIYSKYPWDGQEGAMARGMIKPHFTQSTLSFDLARILLLVVAAIVGFLNRRVCVPAGFALWIGAALIPVLTVATDAEAYHGQFGWFAVVFIGALNCFFIFWPIFGGVLGGAAVGALSNRLWPAAAMLSQHPKPPISS